jgi:hypothetical protein
MCPAEPERAVPPPRHPAWHGWAALAIALLFLACLIGFAITWVLDLRETILAAGARRPPERGWVAGAYYVLGGVFVSLLIAMMAIDRLQKPAEYENTAARIGAGAPFVLYLRPFAIERRLLGYLPLVGGLPYIWTIPLARYLFGLEAYLNHAIEPAGFLLIAIGEMDETVGIAKLKPTDAEWRDLFVDLGRRASAIVVVPFTSAGSVWELDWIVENALAKTVLVLPPVNQDPFIGVVRNHDLPRQWLALRTRWAERLKLPAYPVQGLLLTFRAERSEIEDVRWVPAQELEFGRSDFGPALGEMLRSRGVVTPTAVQTPKP